MVKLFSLVLIAALSVMQSSCTVAQRQNHSPETNKEEEKTKIPPPLHLGAVHQVIPERNFAILRIIGPMPREGTVLISHPADGATDRMGNLLVSGGQHRRGNIIVADIRSGTVIKGDRVFLYRSISESNENEVMPESDDEITEETDVLPDSGNSEPLPDFNTTAAVSNVGSSPFSAPPAIPEEPQREEPTYPEPSIPNHTPTDIPDKLLDVPDTLDGWN